MAKDSIPQKNDVKGNESRINAGYCLNRIMMFHKNNGSCSTNGALVEEQGHLWEPCLLI